MIKKAAIAAIAIPSIIALTFGIMTWSNYNALVRLDKSVDLKQANIKTALASRNSLIVDQLLVVADAYLDHELEIYIAISSAPAEFAAASQDDTFEALLEADMLTSVALTNLFAYAADNPEFQGAIVAEDLMASMETQEQVVRNAREAYNTAANEYNTEILLFPRIMFAKMFGYADEKPLWQMSDGEEIEIEFPSAIAFNV